MEACIMQRGYMRPFSFCVSGKTCISKESNIPWVVGMRGKPHQIFDSSALLALMYVEK